MLGGMGRVLKGGGWGSLVSCSPNQVEEKHLEPTQLEDNKHLAPHRLRISAPQPASPSVHLQVEDRRLALWKGCSKGSDDRDPCR